MSDKLSYINNLVSQGNLAQAMSECITWSKQEPQNPMSHHTLGILLAQEKNYNEALPHFKLAISLNPADSSFHTNIANTYRALDDSTMAEQHYKHALNLSPNATQCFNNLGAFYYKQGRYNDAVLTFEKSLRINPKLWETHFNLANALVQLDITQKAITHYLIARDLNPNFADIEQNLAMAYVVEHKFEDALPMLERACSRNPEHKDLHAQLAEIYVELGKVDNALPQLQQAISLNPDNDALYHNLAVLYTRLGERGKAKTNFEHALRLNKNNPTAVHMLNAYSNNDNPEQAPLEYVSDLFEQYAQFYNKHVKDDLEYKVPELMRSQYSKIFKSRMGAQNILDLGCGTGICGIYFSDVGSHMVGVDISTQMLARAKQIESYDGLCKLNILQTIPGEGKAYFTLILAADVFVYLGKLDGIIEKCSTALAENGVLMFSIEEQDENDSYVLKETGRYGHSEQYIRELCKENHFDIISMEQVGLRKSDGVYTQGYIVTAEKKTSA